MKYFGVSVAELYAKTGLKPGRLGRAVTPHVTPKRVRKRRSCAAARPGQLWGTAGPSGCVDSRLVTHGTQYWKQGRNRRVASSPVHCLSLCGGAGGLELGIKLALPESRVVAVVERDSYAAATLVARMADQALDQDGTCFRRPSLGRRMSGKGFSFWPTPMASLADGPGVVSLASKQKKLSAEANHWALKYLLPGRGSGTRG